VSSRGGVSAVDMYALAKHSPLVLRRIFIQLGKTSCSNARAVLAAGSHHMPRWLWGLLRQARLPQFGQHSEFTSVLAARAQGQENALLGGVPIGPRHCYNQADMRCLILAVFLVVVQTAPPVPRQAPDSAGGADQEVQPKISENKAPAAKSSSPAKALDSSPNEQRRDNPNSPNAQQPIRVAELPPVSVTRDWIDRTTWVFGAILVIVGVLGICAAYRTLKAIERQGLSMKRQTTHLRRSVVQARRAALAAKLSADALINSERAYIDGELARDEEAEKISVIRYKIKITNKGKTPAKILGYKTNFGCLAEGTGFSREKLSSEQTHTICFFLGSDKSETLGGPIDLSIFSNCTGDGAYCVTIRYEDVINQAPKAKVHETAFVYYCKFLLDHPHRISIYDRYT